MVKPLQTEGELLLVTGKLWTKQTHEGKPCGCINGKLLRASGVRVRDIIERGGWSSFQGEQVLKRFGINDQQMNEIMDYNDRQQADQLKAKLVELGIITPNVIVAIRNRNDPISQAVRSTC